MLLLSLQILTYVSPWFISRDCQDLAEYSFMQEKGRVFFSVVICSGLTWILARIWGLGCCVGYLCHDLLQ
jgi:hypothetical protein